MNSVVGSLPVFFIIILSPMFFIRLIAARPQKKNVGAGERPDVKRDGAIPSTVEEIDQFLKVTEVTAKEAARCASQVRRTLHAYLEMRLVPSL